MKAAQLTNLAVFLGIPLTLAALVLARTGSLLLQSAAYAFSAISGVDIDFDFGDDVVHAVHHGAKNLTEPSPERIFDTSASVITIQGDDDAHDADAGDVDDETGFKAEPIEASPLYDYYDAMTCEELRDAIRKLETKKITLANGNAFGSFNSSIEKVEGSLEIAETVRLGKLLGGDTLCNF